MSSTPIFDSLVAEFASKGIRYERLIAPTPAVVRKPVFKYVEEPHSNDNHPGPMPDVITVKPLAQRSTAA